MTNQSRKLDNYPEGTEQSRTVGMFLRSSDLDEMVEHPHLGLKSNPAKLHRCVKKVKARGGADNPWAVCNASIK